MYSTQYISIISTNINNNPFTIDTSEKICYEGSEVILVTRSGLLGPHGSFKATFQSVEFSDRAEILFFTRENVTLKWNNLLIFKFVFI